MAEQEITPMIDEEALLEDDEDEDEEIQVLEQPLAAVIPEEELKQHKNRISVLQEIIESEKKYIEYLDLLRTVYFEPILCQKTILFQQQLRKNLFQKTLEQLEMQTLSSLKN